SQAMALAGKTGQFLLYSGFVTNTVSGLIIGVEGVDQIVKILDVSMSCGEKISALVRVLGTLIVQGVLYVLSVCEVRELRVRVGGFAGKEMANQLSAEVLHSLNLLDDKALRAMAGLTAEQLERIAQLARVDSRLANRLAAMPGLALRDHEVAVAGGVLSLDGEIKLSPAKLAAMSDDEVKQLMQRTKALKAVGGDVSKLGEAEKKIVDALSKTQGQRLRFEAQLTKVDSFLSDVGATADPRGQKLFTNVSDAERLRLFDLPNARRRAIRNIDKQASDFALGRARSVNGYVELLEQYEALYDQEVISRRERYVAAVDREVQERLAANPSMPAREQAKLRPAITKARSMAEFGREIDGTGPQFEKAMADKIENELGLMNDPTKAGSGGTRAQATLEPNVQALAPPTA